MNRLQLLNEDQIDAMWSKRKRYLINLPELAVILNCKHEDVVSAQVGKLVPDEVHRAIVDWLN